MRRARRAAFFAALAAAAVACGLSVTGVPEGTPAGADSATDQASPPRDTSAPVDQSAPDVLTADTGPPCDAGGAFCDFCDPSLVLCVEFDGGLVDQSMYHRTILVHGDGAPAFFVENGRGAISLDGSIGLSVAAHPPTEPFDEETVEVFLRMRKAPPDGGRYGYVDRNGATAIFFYWDGRLTCRGDIVAKFPVDLTTGRFGHTSCVVTKAGKGALFVEGQRVAEGDAAVLEARENESTMLGRDDLDNDAGVIVDALQGDIATVRLYHRALTDEEVRRAHGLDAGP